MKDYRKYERELRNLLNEKGFNGFRVAGSFGEFDVIAFRNGIPYLFQVKTTKNDKVIRISKFELRKIINFYLRHNTLKVFLAVKFRRDWRFYHAFQFKGFLTFPTQTIEIRKNAGLTLEQILNF
ncbi:MAG: hypothetical protein DRN14_06770 [Thermoplasmata archaeon]|nr:MAG: hypothetical protein DRN14_06770 [Thermoplasmata archaeon]